MLGLDVVVNKVFGSRADRLVKKKRGLVSAINDFEPKLKPLADEALRAKTGEFREKLEKGASLDDLLPEAFAVVREAGRRALGMRHFDVQLIGGMILHGGMVAEMKTGEGKTLVATAPVYLNALSGKGVHVVTVNDYLAQRDADWMGRIYRFLGMEVGVILSNERNDQIKRAAYAADITYGTNNEFGFDYLRDNMKMKLEDYVQRGHNYAIVDEVDSILIDEARTPLIISGPTDLDVQKYGVIDAIIPILQRDLDFTVDEKSRSVSLSDDGTDKVEARLGIDNLYDPQNMEVLHHVNQSLRAHFLYKRDKDYVVQGGKVVIVDEHTGRLMHGRRWSDGLHQAIEAKERVRVEAESQTYATITFQNYFRMYGKLAGMTGTAETEAEEFGKIYSLEVVPIPTNRTVARLDHHDVVFKTQEEKFRRVLTELRDCYENRQPVLVGTTSVEKSERVARLLQSEGIPHQVLNAKNHAREAEIVAQAGRLGAITISTNMAGRGTDIKLGGDPEGMARTAVLDGLTDALVGALGEPAANLQDPRTPRERVRATLGPLGPLVSETTPPEMWTTMLQRVQRAIGGLYGRGLGDFDLWPLLEQVPAKAAHHLSSMRAACEAERAEVMKAGGLHILGTERHESRRIDNQLRGRSGRQGDPGSSRFYLSMEDDLLRLFGTDKMIVWMERLGHKDDEPIEHRMITNSIEGAQKKVEGQNFNVRKNLLEYDDVMNLQRKAVYDLRKRALTGENIRQMMLESIHALTVDLMDEHLPAGVKADAWNTEALLKKIDELFTLQWPESASDVRQMARMEVQERIEKEAVAVYDAKEAEFGAMAGGEGENPMRQLERYLLLQFTDQFWKDHLLAMDRLRDGIGLRGYGQRNPLLEYKKEAFNMYMYMTSLRDEAVLSRLLRMRMQVSAEPVEGAGAPGPEVEEAPTTPAPLPPMEPIQFEAPVVARPAKGAATRLFAVEHGVRRNDPCPCGSGLKFKKCCAQEGDAASA